MNQLIRESEREREREREREDANSTSSCIIDEAMIIA